MVLIMLSLALDAVSQTESPLACAVVVLAWAGDQRLAQRLLPGFGWRYSVVLVMISNTALLVMSTFYNGKHSREINSSQQHKLATSADANILYVFGSFQESSKF